MTGVPVKLPLKIVCQLLVTGQVLQNMTTPSPTNTCGTAGVSVPQISTNNEKYVKLPPGYKAFPEFGFAYKYNNTWVNWYEARERCHLEGGSLAIIDSLRKFNTTFGMKPPSAQPVSWIGVHNFYGYDKWTNVRDGSPATFLVWAPNHPSEDKDKHCVAIQHTAEREMEHFSDKCIYVANYFCEIPLK